MKNTFVWWFTWCVVAMIIVAVPIAALISDHDTLYLIALLIGIPVAFAWLAVGVKRFFS